MTTSFFADGYNTKDLMRLKDGLKLLGVKAKPELSIDRLVRGFERVLCSYRRKGGSCEKSSDDIAD